MKNPVYDKREQNGPLSHQGVLFGECWPRGAMKSSTSSARWEFKSARRRALEP